MKHDNGTRDDCWIQGGMSLLLTFSLFGAWKPSMMEFPSSILVTQKQNHGEWKCLQMTIGLYPLR